MSEQNGFIYLWYDRTRKMFYLGYHLGTENDRYICSSNRMKDAYRRRPDDFKRRILQRNIPKEKILEAEFRWLSMISDNQLGKKYYNLHNHHFRHWSVNEGQTKSIKQKLSDASIRLHQDPEYRKKYFEGRKKIPPRTKEHIEKIAKANTGQKRSEETKQRMRCSKPKGPNHPLYGKPFSVEHKRKISEAVMGQKNGFYGKKHSEETKKSLSKRVSITMAGRTPKNNEYLKHALWWNNGVMNKRNNKCPGPEWTRGQLRNNGGMV